LASVDDLLHIVIIDGPPRGAVYVETRVSSI
jgi:hypothetical protein